MTREEFEKKYAMKYRHHDFFHNPHKTEFEIRQLRDGEGYSFDHHLDLCWKVQKIKDEIMDDDRLYELAYLEW